MLRLLFVVLLAFCCISCSDPYEVDAACWRDRSTNDYEGHDQCLRDHGLTEDGPDGYIFDRSEEIPSSEETPLPDSDPADTIREFQD